MVDYTFGPQPAVDITTARLVAEEGLSGALYASEAEAQAETGALTVTVAGGLTATEIGVSAFGQLPEFTVADHYQVWWRSGDAIVHLMSFDGIVEAVEAGAAATAASAADVAAAEEAIAALREWVNKGVTTRNLVTDPRATDATKWARSGDTGFTETMVSSATDGPVLPDGSRATTYARYTVTSVGTGNGQYGTANFPVPLIPAGKQLAIAIYVRSSTAVPSISVRKDAYLAGVAAGTAQAVPSSSLPANTWQRRAGLIINNADCDEMRITAQFPVGSRSVDQVIDVTVAMVVVDAVTVPDHFDGATPSTPYVGYAWTDLPNASASQKIDLSTLVRTVNGQPGPDVTVAAGGGGTTDHNALSNLAVGDPHTQYLTLARALAQFWTRAQVDAMVTAAATQESAQDRARSNHTGTQSIGSIVGLQPALDALAAGSGAPTAVHFIVATTDTTPRPANAGMVIWLDARADKTNPPTNMGDNDRWSPSAAVPTGDLTGPTTPTSLTKGSITASSVLLGWAASTDNVGVTAYEIRRGDGFSYGFQAGTSRTITGLSPSSSYTFQVRARDAAGNVSNWSSTITVDTIASSDSVPPTVPTGLASSGLTSSGFTVTWAAGTDNVGVTGYDVRIGGGSPETVGAEPRSKSFSGLAELTAYTVEVRTRDAAGLTSAWVPISVTTLEGAGETYSVYGAGAPTGTWSLATDGGPYIVFGRGFVCSAAGARVAGGRAWIPTGAGGAKPTEATFYLFGPNAGLGSTPVQTKVVSTAGAAEGSWVEALFDVPEDIETGEVWMIGVRFTGAGDAGKYVYAPNTRPNGDPIISNGDLGSDLAWAAYGSGFSTQYKIGTGSATVPGSYDQSYGVDALVDLAGA